MPTYAELTAAREAMQTQPACYQPSTFWADASAAIVAELQIEGVERFRALPTPLRFFVPTWGVPGGGFTAAQAKELKECFAIRHPGANKQALALAQFLSGEAAALADHRVLLAADDPHRLPHLHTFNESTHGQPVEQMVFDGRRHSRSAMNYLLGLAMLKQHLGDDVPRTVLEIGGGFGTLGEVMATSGIDGWRYIDLDIPPTSFVAQWYLQQVLGTGQVATWNSTRDLAHIHIDQLPPAAVLAAWQIEQLRGQVDLFVNFISFQEMEPAIVRNYLSHVDRLGARWVLLRNMREGKQKKSDGHVYGVDQPILGDDYLQMLPHHELVARATLPFGHRTVDGFHSELMLLQRRS